MAHRALNKRYDLIITSGLYVPGNQLRMLQKCVTTKATLIVPDMEDSVPIHEKDRSREMIRDSLASIRQNASFGAQTVLTPRTNGLETGRFQDDVAGVLNQETVALIDGFCVPKVDRVEDVAEIDRILSEQEAKYHLRKKTLKVVPQIESTKSLANIKDILKAG